jgi:hypothetical protein
LNAAHYEIAYRRLHGMNGAYPGVVFTPAGTTVTVGGVAHAAPPLTAIEQAGREASEAVRLAWTTGLNLHTLWVRANLHRADWTTLDLRSSFGGATAAHFADCMPYWSAVQGLTVHDRPGLDASGTDAATTPVTQLDISLSEGMVRLLSQAMRVASTNFGTAATTNAFLNARSTPAQRAKARTVAATTLLLITALRKAVGEITGSQARDVKVIKAMADASRVRDYSVMLRVRAPGDFR